MAPTSLTPLIARDYLRPALTLRQTISNWRARRGWILTIPLGGQYRTRTRARALQSLATVCVSARRLDHVVTEPAP